MKECNSCGKCCIKYSDGGLSATEDEIETWRLFRPDIYRYVSDGEIWIDPISGKPLKVCPWLKKIPYQPFNIHTYSCSIYQDRPDDCKYYPVTINEMINDKCEMLDTVDLTKPKQAQKTLDRIMQLSRPAS